MKMSREVRQAEPIHVTRRSVGLAALGFVLWGVGYLILWLSPTGGRLEWVLCAAGPLLLALAVLDHLDHHRRRFGLPALVLLIIAIILQAVVFFPYAYDPALSGKLVTFTYATWGAAWLIGSLGVFLVIGRKEARLEHDDTTPETQIHATFFQLTVLAVGMLIYGISWVGFSVERGNPYMGVLSIIGPALIAVALIAHVEHLALRLGVPAVTIAIIGSSVWALKNVPRAVSDVFTERAWSILLVYGVGGIILLMSAVACLLVLVHKKAWVDAEA